MRYAVLALGVIVTLMIQPFAFGAVATSPKGQFASGVDLHEIECKEGFELVFKAIKWSPACVKLSSVEKLISLGWAANHDAQHHKLMESEKMATKDKTNDDEKKSYKIELKESMDMSGN